MRTPMMAGVALAGAALSLAACAPPHPHARNAPLKSISALNCPQSEGALKLQGAASAATCLYGDDAGTQVKLLLVQLDGHTPDQALEPFQQAAEQQLPALAASAAAQAGGATADATDASGTISADNDKADIDLPGIHIHANGDKANVDVAGVHVQSDDTNSHHATVTTHLRNDKVLVNATDAGARIHIDENGSGVRTSFLLAAKDPGPNGWRLAGYEARGPIGGPLAVATLLSKSDRHEALHNDVRNLLKENVGG